MLDEPLLTQAPSFEQPRMEQLAGIDKATDLEAAIVTSGDYDLAAGVAKKLYFLGELCR